MSKPSIEGRLARLETLAKTADQERHKMSEKLDNLDARFTRYEARWGGVMMVVSALFALTAVLKDEIVRWFSGRAN